MYHFYHTEGFVLGSAPYGEADKYFKLYTEELGLITASAKSVRALRSKLRYHLGDGNHSFFTLVRGKELWRITNSSSIYAPNNHFPDAVGETKIIARIFLLLRRLVHGEERNALLFQTVKQAVCFISKKELSTEDYDYFETLVAFRILFTLGYIKNEEPFCQFLSSVFITKETLREFSPFRRIAVSKINSALKASNL